MTSAKHSSPDVNSETTAVMPQQWGESTTFVPLGLQQSVGFRLSRVARARRRAWTEELEAFELTPSQASALRAMLEQPDQSLRALARTLGSDPMSTKRCVDDLERRALVKSSSAPGDRRPRVLNVTSKGTALAREIDHRVRRHEEQLRDVLSSKEYELLSTILLRLETHLDLVDASDTLGAVTRKDADS